MISTIDIISIVTPWPPFVDADAVVQATTLRRAPSTTDTYLRRSNATPSIALRRSDESMSDTLRRG